jgi:simple sugar transport system permease protein
LAAGMLGGALWAFAPAILKAKFGAHEVINTIMMNYIAFRLSEWLLNGPMKREGSVPVSPTIDASAELPRFFPDPIRFHLGFFIALAAAVVVYWILFRTTLGFEIRTVGANPNAARYAGMSITRNFVVAMCLSGALAGLAGTNEVLGVNHNLANAFSSGYGFDSIALALLGKSHPFGVVLAALLFGTLRAGGTRMQNVAKIPVDIIGVIQALVIAFIAAPAIIRAIYRLREARGTDVVFTRGWGK